MDSADERQPDRQRHARRAAEAHNRAEKARERAAGARERLADLSRQQGPDAVPGAGPKGSTADQAERAEELAEESERQAHRAVESAAVANLLGAQVHEEAALMHDRSAALGLGNEQTHRRKARQHREHAEADRAEARRDEELRDNARRDRPE